MTGWVKFETKDEQLERMQKEIYELRTLVSANRANIKTIAEWSETEVKKLGDAFNSHKHNIASFSW